LWTQLSGSLLLRLMVLNFALFSILCLFALRNLSGWVHAQVVYILWDTARGSYWRRVPDQSSDVEEVVCVLASQLAPDLWKNLGASVVYETIPCSS
jgi:hypothetical protein